MKNIILSQQGIKKINQDVYELFYQDLETSINATTPGEWCYFEDSRKKRFYIGFVNSFVENNRPCAYLIELVSTCEQIDEEKYLTKLIEKAKTKRERYLGSKKNVRLIYGQADMLPGLIVDAYENATILQVNTAGIDKHREFLKKYFIEQKFPSVVFLDNEAYRKGEGLPLFEAESLSDNLKLVENDIHFEIRTSVMQKIGFYFDHRRNREKAKELVALLPANARGLDLFSYVGAWGLNLLKAGVAEIDFVDQGNFDQEIEKNLELNNFSGRGNFLKDDVFKFLKKEKSSYNIICSDPPAFCKSKKEALRAREGYTKLHALCLQRLVPGGILIACSCTHYVGHDEFQASVIEAAKRQNKKIQLIDIGVQGLDHPIKGTNTKSSYLKYYAYYVE